MNIIHHAIDWGRHFTLTLSLDGERLSAALSGPPASPALAHLSALVTLEIDGQHHRLDTDGETSLRLADAGTQIKIRIGGDTFGMCRFGAKPEHDVRRQLTVFETRMLGNERIGPRLPYPRKAQPLVLQRTDLHTHSSGQISARGMIEVALTHDIAYPTRLLDILHIAYDSGDIMRTRRFFFPPTDAGQSIPAEEDAIPLRCLSPQGLVRLREALAIPPDRQVTFGDVELTVYRYRTPISKHPAAAYDFLLQTSKEYQAQGITYTEMTASSTSLLTPEYLRFIHEKLPEIEAQTGVQWRFLCGMPRNLPPAQLRQEVERLKAAAASPYIVGIDFMGFEDTKTSQLEPYIESMAAWAHEHDPEFTLRIHAGENRKNMDNVKESLRLAQKHKMRTRIGHATHGLDDDAIAIARELAEGGLAMIEFNPDSNLALNNIDRIEEIDLLRCIRHGIPFVICSDGGGLFQTDANQLALAASFAATQAGIDEDPMEAVRRAEEQHIKRETERFKRKKKALPAHFLEHFPAASAPPAAPATDTMSAFVTRLAGYGIEHSPESIRTATRGKKPLLILGATGERHWNMLDEPHRQQILDIVQQLVDGLDTTKTYFLIGRPKDVGITFLLSRAVQAHNEVHPSGKFALVSATVQADQTAHSFTPGLTHVLPLTGSLFTVPYQLVKHVADAGGHILFIGGGTFVRDAILIARNKGVSFGVMNGPAGASSEKAGSLHESRQFTDAKTLTAHLRQAHPDWFKS